MLAVAEQEATYQADPVGPALARLPGRRSTPGRPSCAIPEFMVRTALCQQVPTGKSYAARIDALRTERVR